MSIFIFIQIICILIGMTLICLALNMLRPREEEQKLIQGKFLFYLILGLFFLFFTFLI
jgi:hypothetical protein